MAVELADDTYWSFIPNLSSSCKIHSKSSALGYSLKCKKMKIDIHNYLVLQGKKYKKLFWVPAVAPLISVVISTLCVYLTHAEKQGVQTVSMSIS